MAFMNNYLIDLIERMLDDEWRDDMVSSEDTVSYQAFREAEKLNDVACIADLKAYIENEQDNKHRKCAYFILTKIVKNTHDENALQFLIHQLKIEKNNNSLITLLSALVEVNKPSHIDLQPIFELIHHHQGEYESYLEDDEHVKSHAIYALKHSQNRKVEPLILNIMQALESSDDFRLWYCFQVLQTVGTTLSLSVMERFIHHKNTEYASLAFWFLAMYGNEKQLPIFEKHIQESKYKDLALLGLVNHGNDTHIELIISRVKNMLSRKRKYETMMIIDDVEKSELVVALEFLQKYANQNTEIIKFFEWIKMKKWDKLFDDEKEFINLIQTRHE